MTRLLLVPLACSLFAADEKEKAGAASSVITAANYEKIKMGMTEADVLAVLGPPHHERPFTGGESLVWEDRNGISVRYKDGKAVRIEGRFNKHIRSRSVNEANYQALKLGMTQAEVEKVLVGYPARLGKVDGPLDDVEYVHHRLILVHIQGGKVVGMSRESSEEVGGPGDNP